MSAIKRLNDNEKYPNIRFSIFEKMKTMVSEVNDIANKMKNSINHSFFVLSASLYNFR
jgi:hypothetical protein